MSYFNTVQVSDGVNSAGVTPASTAAVATQPAEVVALSPNTPLPEGTNTIGAVTVTGVATAANQATEITALGTIDTDVKAVTTAVGVVNTTLSTTNTALGTIDTDVKAVTTAVGVVNTTLSTTNTSLGTIDTDVKAVTTAVSALATANHTDLLAVKTALGTPFQAGGTVTANVGTTNGLALDSSIQSLITAVKATVDMEGTVWFDATVTPVLYYVRRETVNQGTGAITVSWVNPSGVTATPTVANLQPVSNAQSLVSTTLTYSASAGGTGYSTGDMLVHTFAMDTQTTPATVAYSIWLNSNTGAILSTPPTTGTYNATTQAVSATSLPLPTGAATSALQTTGNTALATINTTLGTPMQATGGVVGLAAGSANVGSITNITGTVSLPTGAATSALQTTGNTALATINTTLGTPMQATGGVVGLAAGSNNVGSITNITGTVSLPTGAATSALQTTGNTALSAIQTAIGTPMQATGGVVGLAAGSNNVGSITNITGTVSLPTGAATAALQTTGNTTLAAIQTALGSGLMQATGGTVGLVAGTATIGSVKVTDGTNTGAVTAASTAATAANPAQVVALSPNSPLPAGTNALGTVGITAGTSVAITQTTYGSTNAVYTGGTSQVQVTPTVTAASAYGTGVVVGGLLTFANVVQPTVLSGVLESITIAVKSAQTTAFKLYIFNSAPSTTFTDKTAPAIVVGDATKLIDVYPMSNPDSGLGTNVTIYTLSGIARSLVLAGTSLYAVLIVIGTPTFTTTTDVIVTVSIMKD